MQDLFETLDCILQGDQFAQMSCENFSNLERLRQEALDFTGSGHSQFIFFWQLIHTQDGNDILQRFVILQEKHKSAIINLYKSREVHSKQITQKKSIHLPARSSALHEQHHNAHVQQYWGP